MSGIGSGLKVIRALRLALGFLVVGLCGYLIVESAFVRSLEALATRPLVAAATSGGTTTSGATIISGLGTSHAAGLTITAECTVIVMLVPIGLAVGLLLAFSHISAINLILGGIAAAVTAILVNQLRVALIAMSLQRWGVNPGYEVSHKFVGSVIALIGFVLSFLVLAKVVARGGSAGQALSSDVREGTASG